MSRYLKYSFALSSAGILFSGYLSATKLFSGTCAFNESCPYFLGYPACFYGFGFFTILFVSALLGVLKVIGETRALKNLFLASLGGILFSGSFTVQEISAGRIFGHLGLSTCAYGLIFFVAIFIISLIAFKEADR